MSEKSANEALEIAGSIPGGYPINSGHNGFRNMGAGNENARSDAQLERINALGGIMGVGYGYAKDDGTSQSFSDVINSQGGPTWTSSDVANSCGGSARAFAQSYLYALEKFEKVAIGTDTNGLGAGPGPRFGSLATLNGNRCSGQTNRVNYVGLPRSGDNEPLTMLRTGNRQWNINEDGVAHYGLLPDFLQDLKNVGLNSDDFTPLFISANDFAQMWERSLRTAPNVR